LRMWSDQTGREKMSRLRDVSKLHERTRKVSELLGIAGPLAGDGAVGGHGGAVHRGDDTDSAGTRRPFDPRQGIGTLPLPFYHPESDARTVLYWPGRTVCAVARGQSGSSVFEARISAGG